MKKRKTLKKKKIIKGKKIKKVIKIKKIKKLKINKNRNKRKLRVKQVQDFKPTLRLKIGLELKNEHFNNGSICVNNFKPELEYNWDTGKAIGKYLEGLNLGKTNNDNNPVIPKI